MLMYRLFAKIQVIISILFIFLWWNQIYATSIDIDKYKPKLDNFLINISNLKSSIEEYKYKEILSNIENQLQVLEIKYQQHSTIFHMIEYLNLWVKKLKNNNIEVWIQEINNLTTVENLQESKWNNSEVILDPGVWTYKPYKDKDIYIVDYRWGFPGCINRIFWTWGLQELNVSWYDHSKCGFNMWDFLYFDGEKYAYAKHKSSNIYAIRISTWPKNNGFSFQARNAIWWWLFINSQWSISKLPWDVENSYCSKNWYYWTPWINYSPRSNTKNWCEKLELNSNYYLNIIYTDLDKILATNNWKASNIFMNIGWDINFWHYLKNTTTLNKSYGIEEIYDEKDENWYRIKIHPKDIYFWVKYLYSYCIHKEREYFYKNTQWICINAKFNCEWNFLKYSWFQNHQEFPLFTTPLYESKSQCIWNGNLNTNSSTENIGNTKAPYIWSKAPSFWSVSSWWILCSNIGIDYNSINAWDACSDESFVCHTNENKWNLLKCIKNSNYSGVLNNSSESSTNNNNQDSEICDHIKSYLTGCEMD